MGRRETEVWKRETDGETESWKPVVLYYLYQNCIHINHRLELSPTNQIASAHSCSLIGQYLDELPDKLLANSNENVWLVCLEGSVCRKVNKSKKQDLGESSIFIFSL